MANVLVGAEAPVQRAIEMPERGINLSSLTIRYFPQFKDKLEGYDGQNRCFSVPAKLCRDIKIQGEVSEVEDGETSDMQSLTLAAAIVLANDVDTYGDGSGGIYFDEATEGQTRQGWRGLDISASSDPKIP